MSLVARRAAGAILILLAAAAAQAAQPLQPWLDAAPAGAVLRLPPGTYAGPAVLEKPLTLDGNGEVTIDGGGRGSVLTIRTHGAVVRGLRIVRSGESHDAVDSGIVVAGNGNRIENNVVEDVLFGITLHQANDNRVAGNRIRSKPWDIADRGDGLRLWYSMGNRIENNDIAQIRDVTVSNSPRNRYVGNTIRDSRRAMNFLFSHRSLVEGNRLSHNATGLTILNSDGIVIRGNHIAHAMDASGAGIAIKESSAALVHDNDILHCAVGILADSPLHSLNRISIVGNRLSHNVTGISFYGERGGHLVLANRFAHNLWQATVGGDERGDMNVWLDNHWDDYQGFDRDGDGIGDTPYEIWAHADRIWMDTPMARFFRNSPVLEMLDFLERLAPFSSPVLLVRDPRPVAHGR
ncbi:MAG: nitrous oxide reductase family maturation protein NosD [Rhodocyclaceae bacterium]|nr:nitrous oxide reductase family maturation protein NosD [Rhodocyclaceae bacterium]